MLGYILSSPSYELAVVASICRISIISGRLCRRDRTRFYRDDRIVSYESSRIVARVFPYSYPSRMKSFWDGRDDYMETMRNPIIGSLNNEDGNNAAANFPFVNGRRHL